MVLRSPAFQFAIGLALCSGLLSSFGQTLNEPVVARLQMQILENGKTVETIEKGDLLTVIGERDQAYVVLTLRGARGRVDKTNAVKMAESVEVYDELIEASPQEGRLHTLRAAAWSARGEKEKALADFDRAIQLGYREGHAFASRGMFHSAAGNYDAAIKDFTQAVQTSPRDEVSYLNRAAVYVAQGKIDLALRDYDAAILVSDRNPRNYEQRAMARRMKEDYRAAAADFTKAIELDPNAVTAWMGRGYVWFLLGKNQAAVDDFSAAIELAPKSAMAYNNRGYNRQLLGELDKALADFDQSIALDPGYGQSYQNKAWLLATSSDDSIRDGQEAVRLATKACELSEYKDIQDLQTLAAAFAENKQFDRAIGWQEKVVSHATEEEKTEAEKLLALFKADQPYREPTKR